MFLWTPILLFSVAALVVLATRDCQVGWPCLFALILFYYTVAAYQNWHGQSAYGSRFFLALHRFECSGSAFRNRA
jgi:hypothetical protein